MAQEEDPNYVPDSDPDQDLSDIGDERKPSPQGRPSILINYEPIPGQAVLDNQPRPTQTER